MRITTIASITLMFMVQGASAQRAADDPYALYLGEKEGPYQYCWKNICMFKDMGSCVAFGQRIDQIDPRQGAAVDLCKPYTHQHYEKK